MRLFKGKERARQRPSNSTTVYSKKPSLNYYSPAPPAETKKSSKTRSWFVPGKLLKSLLAVIGLSFLAYNLYLNPITSITLVKPQAPALSLGRNQDVYLKEVKNIFAKSIFNRTKITLNTQKIENEMLLKFPELETVKVIVPFVGSKPTASLKLKEISLIFSNGTQFYAVDNTGRAILTTTEFPDLLNLGVPVLTDQSRPEITPLNYVLSKTEVQYIKTVANQLSGSNISVSEYFLPALPNELHVRLSGLKYIVKFDLKSDPRSAVGVLLAVKTKLDSDNIIPSQYIDVRVEERAYYK